MREAHLGYKTNHPHLEPLTNELRDNGQSFNLTGLQNSHVEIRENNSNCLLEGEDEISCENF